MKGDYVPFRRVLAVSLVIIGLGWLAAKYGLVIAILVGLFVVHGFSPDFLAIDRCLDHGGVWSYEIRQCEYMDRLE